MAGDAAARLEGPLRVKPLLRELDARIDETTSRLSLGGGRATSLVDLFEKHAPEGQSAQLALMRSLHRVATAQLDSFPETIFWDFDALGAHLAELAIRSDAPRLDLARVSSTIAALQHLFGHRTPIHFRYVHDFMFGYDWAKWVARDPDARGSIGPFDERFLGYMWRRGHELLLLIANDDEKYPKLSSGRPRNPFGFSREPNDERKLFETLAKADEIPVRAWEPSPQPTWNRPFQKLRDQCAESLGIRRAQS